MEDLPSLVERLMQDVSDTIEHFQEYNRENAFLRACLQSLHYVREFEASFHPLPKMEKLFCFNILEQAGYIVPTDKETLEAFTSRTPKAQSHAPGNVVLYCPEDPAEGSIKVFIDTNKVLGLVPFHKDIICYDKEMSGRGYFPLITSFSALSNVHAIYKPVLRG